MTTAGAEPPIQWRGLAWALLPPVAVLLLRAALQAQTDEATASLNSLQTATLVTTPGEAMWAAARPFVLALVAAAVVIGGAVVLIRRGVHRQGWPRTRPRVIAAWIAVCVIAAGALLASHLNRSGRQAQAAREGEVLLVRPVPPSERGVGGAEVYLQLAGDEVPVHLLAEGQPATAFAPRSTVRLQSETGRWWGRWGTVTPGAASGVPARPAASASSSPGNR